MFYEKSFTITELMVVMAIVAVLALIGVPAFRAYQPALALSGAVKELATDLRYAEQLAVTEQIDHGVRFFLDTDQYQIIKYSSPEEIIKSKNLPTEVNFQTITGLTDNEAVFNPYGAARESGSVVFVNTKNATSTIDIRPSGFIKTIK